ncbi:MAG TPA: PRC-barrel domain-containing protein [Aliidongia sp.]|nr:PRC-barrel domain-containing protein [Aliidongia sp.]
MNKIIARSGLAVVMAVSLGSAAFASDTMIQTDQMRASKIIGSSVYDRNNQDVASVKDMVLGKDGKVADVVLTYGSTAGIGGKYVAVPFASLKLNNNRLTLDQTKDQLAAMPQYQLEDKNSGAGEGAVPATGGHAGK